jgi:mannose-6-phosphate isomerase-like protein (cupin superfamily)
MDIESIPESSESFRIIQTRQHTQTAVIHLNAKDSSSENKNTHSDSEQTIVVLEGQLSIEVGDESAVMMPRQSLIIPAGTPHRLFNDTDETVIAFTVYSPPVYPPALPRS